ncbi:BTB/POZ domain-containing protein 6-like [Babylonia areolata]|uniref:BTB/POZ domain-containing protein 6-like n=1 Tax=Babylonia areolata TaxID=304850 RepID=UPI003FD655F3
MTGGVYPGLGETSPVEEEEKEKPPPPPTYADASSMSVDSDPPTTGNWQRGKGVLACNRHMLEYQLACDIWFRVGGSGGGEERVGAHRYVLQSRSGAFFAMLDGPGAERSEISLPDVQPKVLWQLLRYMYYEELDPNSDTVFELLALADKYDVARARDVCLSFLHGCLTEQTACDILETAHRHDDEDLDKECMVFIRKHGENVIQTEGMDRLCRECLNRVLTMEGLEISPVVRQEVTDRWARRQCEDRNCEPTEDNKLESLGDVIYVKRDERQSHRFILDSVTDRQLSGEDKDTAPSPPPPLYSELSVDSGGGGGEDVPDNVSVSSMSSTGSKRSLQSQYSRQHSTATWPDLNQVTRFKEMYGTADNDGTADAITFTVDSNIYLYGFGIYGSKKQGEAAFKVDTILTRKKRDLIMESIAIKGAGVILPVMFERPVKVQKGKPYTLEIYVQGPTASHRGTEGLSTVTDGRTTFKFSKPVAVKGNRTTELAGQIPRLYFMPY